MLSLVLFQHDPSSSSSSLSIMSVMPLMVRSVVRMVRALVGQPASTFTTLLYYSDLLPRNLNLERFVRHEHLDPDNYLFHFLINVLRCFW